MARRTKAQHGDRAAHTVTGEVGTIIDVHTGSSSKSGNARAYSVLLDSGSRATVVWDAAHVDWTPPTGKRICHRCGESGHNAIGCTKGDMP